jgi:NADH-quinone oxidoreductase subunit N
MILTTLFENNLKLFLPEFFLAAAILTIVLYGSVYSASRELNYPLVNLSTCNLSILTLLITSGLVFSTNEVSSVIFNGTFVCDALSQNAKLFVIVGATVSLMMNLAYVQQERINSFEYFLLVLLAVFGLMLLSSSFDLISAYLAIELQSLCLYVLAAFNRESAYSTEAGLKYFILGAFSSGLLLFGISILYGFTGTTNFEDLHLLFSLESTDQRTAQMGVAFISCALLFKISAAPFHVWSPDVYDGAPLNSTIFFALVPKIALIVLFLRIFFFCFGAQPGYWQTIISFCAVSSVLVGSFIALKQRKIKRLLAYSSVGHVGYILIAFSSGNLMGFHASILYIFSYMLMGAGVWCIVSSLENCDLKKRTKTLADLSSLNKSNPTLAFSGAGLIFSMAGVPPLIGFYAKLNVFLASVNASMFIFSITILLVSVVSTYYYIRIVKTFYFEGISKRVFYMPISKENSFILGSSFFFSLFFFVNPNLLWLTSYEMSLCVVY